MSTVALEETRAEVKRPAGKFRDSLDFFAFMGHPKIVSKLFGLRKSLD